MTENQCDMMLKGRGRNRGQGDKLRVELTDEQKAEAMRLRGCMSIRSIAQTIGAGKNKVRDFLAFGRTGGGKAKPVTSAQRSAVLSMRGKLPARQIAKAVGLGRNKVYELLKESEQ